MSQQRGNLHIQGAWTPVALNIVRVLLFVGAIGVWEWMSGRWIDEFWVSRPTEVLDYIYSGFRDGDLLRHVLVTLNELAIGYVVGAIVGFVAAVLLHRSVMLSSLLEPYIAALNGIPRVAIGPLMIVWFGIGIMSKIVLVASLVVFLVFYNTYAGLKSVDPGLVTTARIFRASPWFIESRVRFPAALPWIMTGLRIGIPYGLIGAIVGEFIASNKGLGYLVQRESNVFNATGSIAVIVLLAVIVILLNALLGGLEGRILKGRSRDASSSVQMTL